MKGKKIFNPAEAEQIRRLIRQKLVADSTTQKQLRRQIRDLGFFITDFTTKKKFTVEDFDRFVTVKA